MDAWFEHLVKEVIWEALKAKYGELKKDAAEEVHQKLVELQQQKVKILNDSPLVAVVGADADTVTLLARGRFRFFGGSVAPFMRLQVKVSTTVDPGLDPPIKIVAWQTVVGDLVITKKDVFTAELAFGYDKGAWLGRGALKVIPAGFGLDLLLGGVNEKGLMVGIDGSLPAPIPLGGSGLVLMGVGGDFAYNFVPRLAKGVPIKSAWDASDYVAWARDDEDKGPDRWVQVDPADLAADPSETAVGVGLRGRLGDLATLGWLMSLDPIGLAVLTPGLVFILGGKGKLINTEGISIEGHVAVDIPSESIALGLHVHAEEPDGWKWKLLDATGSLDAYFSFQHPSDWYVHFGTKASPVQARVLDLLGADVFLMLGHGVVPAVDGTELVGAFFGLGLSYGPSWSVGPIDVDARIGARAGTAVGWNPLELVGSFAIYGELKLTIWDFGLRVVVQAPLTGYVPKPTSLSGEVDYSIDLPWPLSDIEGTIGYTIGSSSGEFNSPELKSVLLVGSGD
jgi:hypothetical protein